MTPLLHHLGPVQLCLTKMHWVTPSQNPVESCILPPLSNRDSWAIFCYGHCMAQDDEFFIDGRTSKRSGSQGSPKTRTSKGGGSSQPIVKLGTLSGGSMSFTKRLAKDMAIAKRSSGRKSYAKPSKPRTGRFNARGRGRSALAAGIGLSRSWQTFDGCNIRYRSRRAI